MVRQKVFIKYNIIHLTTYYTTYQQCCQIYSVKFTTQI